MSHAVNTRAHYFDILSTLPNNHEFCRDDIPAGHVLRRKYGHKNIMLRVNDVEFYGDSYEEVLTVYAASLEESEEGAGGDPIDDKIDEARIAALS